MTKRPQNNNMRVYLKDDVLTAAKKRIRWLFDEFENVIVNISGGKDSTVIFHLTIEIARELGRLPLTVRFIDQEAEWQATIDVVRSIMERDDVRPRWYQMPIRLFNATSTREPWLYCWDADAEDRWMRPRESYSIHENVYGTDRFAEVFPAILATEHADERTAVIAGVRAEESPHRLSGITGALTYKDATWGRVESRARDHYVFYPIYDWTYSDVWKAIHDHGWVYNRIYDVQYQWGMSVREMRVSNVHHETSVFSLFYAQEAEPETYERLTQRIAGIDTAAKMNVDDYFPDELPFMFASWREYRDFLLERLVPNEEWRDGMRRAFARHDRIYTPTMGDKVHRLHVRSILLNDWEHIKLINFESTREAIRVRLRNAGLEPWGGKS